MAQMPLDGIDEGNELAERLGAVIERVQPYKGTIAALLLASVVALAAWTLTSSQLAATRAQSWDAYLSALATGDPAAFQDVIARHPDSTAADWSRLVLAEMSLRDGADLAFSDRASARGRLESASDLYRIVLGNRPRGMLAERATFGLAKAREGLGQLDEARQGYEAVAREFPFGGLASLAGEHASELTRESTRKWYDWFESQDVAPAAKKEAAPAADAKAEGPAKVGPPAKADEPAKAEPAAKQEPAAEPESK